MLCNNVSLVVLRCVAIHLYDISSYLFGWDEMGDEVYVLHTNYFFANRASSKGLCNPKDLTS